MWIFWREGSTDEWVIGYIENAQWGNTRAVLACKDMRHAMQWVHYLNGGSPATDWHAMPPVSDPTPLPVHTWPAPPRE